MEETNIYRLIFIDDYAATPKYVQLVNSIIKAVREGKLPKGYNLPSINNVSYELEVSRDTIGKAYNMLKDRGVVGSVPGKGYFIEKTETKQLIKIFLLFNKLSVHKKMIYDTLSKEFGEDAIIDLYVYNNDFSLFKKFLQNRRSDYDYYIIIPHFLEGGDKAYELLNTLPKKRLILMSQTVERVTGDFGAVYEDFAGDIYRALTQALERLKHYKKINIIFPVYTYHPRAIVNGFRNFCNHYDFDCEIIPDVNELNIRKGNVYISLMEDDLIVLVKKVLKSELNVGKDVGIISYNEIPIKELILNGITTISADFKIMGQEVARLVKTGSKEHIAVPFKLTLRDSL